MTRRWFGMVGVCSICGLFGGDVFGESAVHPDQEIRVTVAYSPATHEEGMQLRVALLDDTTDLLAHITRLQEDSKKGLEPLVKRYIHAAEMLTQLRAATAEEKAPIIQRFRRAERQIDDILSSYRQQIDQLLERATLNMYTASTLDESFVFSGIPSGNYRVYAELMFSTTTLRWFESVSVKGGDDGSVNLTRDNLKNPYWTDLNWWSFMNLDFSKHH